MFPYCFPRDCPYTEWTSTQKETAAADSDMDVVGDFERGTNGFEGSEFWDHGAEAGTLVLHDPWGGSQAELNFLQVGIFLGGISTQHNRNAA